MKPRGKPEQMVSPREKSVNNGKSFYFPGLPHQLGWVQVGPYIHININPVMFSLGPLALRWYGLMYVVAIVMGLWLIRRYTARQGIQEDHVYRVLWWCNQDENPHQARNAEPGCTL